MSKAVTAKGTGVARVLNDAEEAVRGAVIFSTTEIVDLGSAEVAEKIAIQAVRYANLSTDALAQAERAVIGNQDTLNAGTDLVKLITANVNAIEKDRKEHTEPLDTLKKYIMGLFSNSTANFTKAKATISGKMNDFARAEQRRKEEEARAAAKIAEDQALALAAAQAALGDNKGADQIIEQAAEVITDKRDDAKVVGSGAFGGSASARTTYSGVSTNYKALIEWLVVNRPGEITDAIDFKKSFLNKLAKEFGEAGKTVPGLNIEKNENWVVR